LVAGERRWRATQRAGLARIPAIVRDIPDDKLLELALIENIQRQELNPIEEAKAYQSLIGTLGLTHEITAARVGRDRSSIANSLRLLKLPEDVQQMVAEDKITAGHAKAILGLPKEDMLRSVARTIVDKGISVRETEALVKRLIESQKNPTKPPAPTTRITPDANFKAAESKLIRRFGTKVRIIPNQKAPGGRIEIEYYGDKDLDRVYRMLNPQDQPQDN
jgi:ParB family chromosome partitioning protein